MILVFGSINLDLVVEVEHLPRPGETVLGPGYRKVAGGKGANQALAARRTGAEVALAGAVGTDEFAGVALALLREDGVDLSLLRTDPDTPTGCAFICVDRRGENLIAVASGANRLARAAQVPDDRLGPGTTLLLQMEIPAEETFSIARRAHAAGAHTLLNVAPAAPIPIEALADLDWLLLNEGEAATVARGLGLAAAGPHETAGRIAEATDVGVVVTLGAEGAVAAVGAERWAVQALLVEPVDTTGAGDAFVGAFAAALDLGRPVEEALRFASAAGGLACLVLGAQPSLPRRDAIERALARLPAAAPF